MHVNTVSGSGAAIPLGGFVPAPGHSTSLLIPTIGEPVHYQFRLGQTVAEIAAAALGNTAHVEAEIWDGSKWVVLAREWWPRIRPKGLDVLRFVYRLHGGDGAGQIFAIVAAIATAFIAPQIGAALATAAISATVITAVATVALNVGFALLGSVLFPPSTGTQTKAERDASVVNSVESEQNVLAVGGYLPFVAGYARISPPEVMQPFNHIDKGKQVLERNFALEGHHAITMIEGDDTPLADFDLAQVQTRNGAIETTTHTFLKRVGKTVQVGKELVNFRLDEDDAEDQSAPENSLPQPVQFTSTYMRKLDEMAFRLSVQALITTKDADRVVSLPLRIELRPKGTTDWFNLPEIHIQGAEAGEVALDVRFRWAGAFQDALSATDISGAISYRFWSNVPGYAGQEWTADEQFRTGTGAQDTENIAGFRNGLQVRLDEARYPRGEYEFRVRRGLSINQSSVSSTYGLPGSTESLFQFEQASGTWTTHLSQSNFPGRVSIGQCVSMSDQRPVQRPGTAQIALRTRQSILRITALAAGIVPVWNGSNWTTNAASRNPADHYRALLRAEIINRGMDLALIDDASIEAWHEECAARDYQVSTILAGQSWTEQASRIAPAGFARAMYTGTGYGVDFFRDRSGEQPVMTFSPRNTRLAIKKQRIERPAAFRCRFRDEADGYREREISVPVQYQSTHPKQASETFENVSREKDVRRQVFFQMESLQHQSSLQLQITSSLEGSKLREGSLIGVTTDLLTDYEHGFRIRKVVDASTFVLDHAVAANDSDGLFDLTNIFAAQDLFAIGAKSQISFVTPEGPERRYVTQVADRTVTLDQPLTTADPQTLLGQHVSIVPEDSITFRCLVTSVSRSGDHGSQVLAVPEAPIIHQRIVENFG